MSCFLPPLILVMVWVPCLLSERSETASMYTQRSRLSMPTASVGMIPVLAVLSCRAPLCLAEEWQGLDDKIGRMAEKAGHPQRASLFHIDGDLELFMFLAAGAAGGFIGGYAFRSLFPPKKAAIAAETSPLPPGEG
jgi:hypothetical protein